MITKLGELEHVLLLQDSLVYMKYMKDDSVDVILTDVPYNFDERTKETVHDEFMRIARDTVIVFSPLENPWILPASQYLFWIKPISTKNTSKHYSRFVEIMFVYHKHTNPITWNTNRHWSQYTNVFTDLVDTVANHPFRKPPSLIERIILNHTNEGDLVFDPFCGSGVVGEVCAKLGRKFLGIEKDIERYEDACIAVKKWC